VRLEIIYLRETKRNKIIEILEYLKVDNKKKVY